MNKVRVKCEYYKVNYRRFDSKETQPDGEFDLSLWINEVSKLSIKDRTKNYYQDEIHLDRIQISNTRQFFLLRFMRLRQTNLPYKAKSGDEAQPMTLGVDEYLGEGVHAIYDDSIKVLMLQRNYHSINKSGIEKYINHLWDNDEYEIMLNPICPKEIQQRILNATEYRTIKLKFADVPKSRVAEANRKSRLPLPIEEMYNAFSKYKPLNAQITLSMGHNRKGALDKGVVTETIDALINNEDCITGAEISYRNGVNEPVEVMDLFDAKLNDIITVSMERGKSIAHEFMWQLMQEQYEKSRGKVNAALY